MSECMHRWDMVENGTWDSKQKLNLNILVDDKLKEVPI